MRRSTTLMIYAVLLSVLTGIATAQEKKVKVGLTQEDWKYTLAEGVTTREATFYSDGTACYAKFFFPRGFSTQGKTPGVVLAHGWAAVHFSIEKYAARFAERGLVAMLIDYRGWGGSDGFVSTSQPFKTSDDALHSREDRCGRQTNPVDSHEAGRRHSKRDLLSSRRARDRPGTHRHLGIELCSRMQRILRVISASRRLRG
ncbi:MAG: hypothetical protein WAU45_13490 [Blastocatellia bacterium]